MKPLVVNIPHELGRIEARRRLDEGADQLQRQMSSGVGSMLVWSRRWEHDRLHFEAKSIGQTLTGRMDVMEESVRIEIDLPRVLAGLAERIAGRLRDTSQKLLQKQKDSVTNSAK